MPAAAVIPAPIAYIKVVAVKKLVVEFREKPQDLPRGSILTVSPYLLGKLGSLH